MVHTVTHRRNDAMQQCVDACTHCAAVCSETTSHCLEKGGNHAEAAHITLMLDCADVCSLSARLMTRGSTHEADLCRVCATICRDCAESCASVTPSDEMMTRCADICRECADECARMAAA